MQAALNKGKERLENAIAEYEPNRIFAGFSGGTDSLMATHLLHQLRSDVGTLHVNTGIGMKRTRQYVRETSDQHGWDLEEYRATDYGYDYDEMVRGNVDGVPGGFPGPPLHYIYYGKLKEVPIQRAHRDHKGKRGGKIALVTGIRKDESEIRAGYQDSVVDELNGVVWINLIYEVTAKQKQKYIDLHGLDTNPVSDVYGMSGECLCGAYAHPGDLEAVRRVCPALANRLEALGEEISPSPAHEMKWDMDEIPEDWKLEANGQQDAFRDSPDQVQPLCHDCTR